MIDDIETPESAIGSSPSGPNQVEATNQQGQKGGPATLPRAPQPSETQSPLENHQKQSPVPSQSEPSENKEIKLTNQVLVSFLEKQKYSASENQSLTPNQQEFNKRVDDLIQSLNKQPDQLINQETFIQALNFGYERNLPEEINQIESLISQMEKQINDPSKTESEKKQIEEKVKFLKEILKGEQELLKKGAKVPDEVRKQIENVFNKLEEDPELKKQIFTHLENGNFDEVMDVIINQNLKEEPGDSEETKKEKSRALKAIKWTKDNAPKIGGVIGILLLLMILQAAKSGGGQGQMMG